jgi:hypothetical protein
MQFVPHRKHNTSQVCNQKVCPLDHKGGRLEINGSQLLSRPKLQYRAVAPRMNELVAFIPFLSAFLCIAASVHLCYSFTIPSGAQTKAWNLQDEQWMIKGKDMEGSGRGLIRSIIAEIAPRKTMRDLYQCAISRGGVGSSATHGEMRSTSFSLSLTGPSGTRTVQNCVETGPFWYADSTELCSIWILRSVFTAATR